MDTLHDQLESWDDLLFRLDRYLRLAQGDLTHIQTRTGHEVAVLRNTYQHLTEARKIVGISATPERPEEDEVEAARARFQTPLLSEEAEEPPGPMPDREGDDL